MTNGIAWVITLTLGCAVFVGAVVLVAGERLETLMVVVS